MPLGESIMARYWGRDTVFGGPVFGVFSSKCYSKLYISTVKPQYHASRGKANWHCIVGETRYSVARFSGARYLGASIEGFCSF